MELSPSQDNNGYHHRNSEAAQPKPITRIESISPYPTTFVQTDTSSFKQIVQMLTGYSETNSKHTSLPSKPHNTIPPIKSSQMKQQHGGGFRIYERRNLHKINPLHSTRTTNSGISSARKPEILSPSILDFPAIVLSPDTPLLHDPFGKSCAASPLSNDGVSVSLDKQAEEKAIKEKGFYFHPSPASTPRDGESPRLLPLFPMKSPREGPGCSDS